MKVCLMEQSCGLGDILLSIKIGAHFASQGYKIVWPVEPIYSNLASNIYTVADIEFPCVEADYELKEVYQKLAPSDISNVTQVDDILYVPLRRGWHSNYGLEMRKSVGSDEVNMLAKFGMCNVDYNNWQNYFFINRNLKKENELLKILDIEPTDRIHLVNREFGTPPRWRELLQRPIPTPPGLKRIEMRVVEGYDLFDWISIFERAAQIDTVSTSNFYIFEKINLQCIPTIYSKNNMHRSFEDNWGWMQKLAVKQYRYVS